MRKYTTLSALVVAAAIAVASSCVSAPQSGGRGSGLSPAVTALVRDAVFEVVVKKPEADSLSYDRPLDWSVVPYSIRQDKYYSIGTAFAVSKSELVTAFHVMDLGERSRVFDAYYIRDSRGEVYEVDTIVRGSNERDFLVFTVKGRVFERFFDLSPRFEVGAQVYSVGNALGEGVIVRNGLVLGTLPEEEAGRWNLLKSSADGNPGNSGGPLITPDGKVVGVVSGLKDNILYSLPAQALLETPSDFLRYRRRLNYGHLLLPNKHLRIFETEIKLPASYKELLRTIPALYAPDYDAGMKALFAEAPAYLEGSANAYFYAAVPDSSFPELAFVDNSDKQWKLSDLKVERFNLEDDGFVIQAKVAAYAMIKVGIPTSSSLGTYVSDPKALLDLMLTGLTLERSLGASNKYRITSFGAPAEIGEYRDSVGRLWIRALWQVEFEDRALIMYALPMPDGFSIAWTYQPTASVDIYDWDLKAVCDRVHAGYSGSFAQWERFMGMKKWLPEVFKDLELRWVEKDRTLSISDADLSFTVGPDVFDWDPRSSLFLSPSYYAQDGVLRYGIRKVLLQRDLRGREFIVLYKNVKPDARLGAKALESWDALLRASAPFDGKPGINAKDKVGAMGALLPQAEPSAEARYSLYLSMEEAGDEASLARRFSSLRESIKIVR